MNFEKSFQIENSSRWIGTILASKLLEYDIVIPEIQRLIDTTHVQEIVDYQIEQLKYHKKFNFLGTINIHYCIATERYYLTDGQHRYETIKKLHHEMGHDMEIVIEYIEVATLDELRHNYKIINQNTILPEFPEDIDRNIVETVAKRYQQLYPTIWSKSPNAKRPNLYFNHFQEGLAIICLKIEITNSIQLFKLIDNYNTNAKGWDRCNFPDYETIQPSMLEKCKKTGIYLGMFKHTSDEFKYRWVTDIIRMETNIDYEQKKRTKAKRTSVSSTVVKTSWLKYTNDQYRPVHCICCNYNQITPFNFHAGHIISHANGGSSDIDNIMPLCASCNLSMSSKNMDVFIREAYPQNVGRFLARKYRFVGEVEEKKESDDTNEYKDIDSDDNNTDDDTDDELEKKEKETNSSSGFASYMFGLVSR